MLRGEIILPQDGVWAIAPGQSRAGGGVIQMQLKPRKDSRGALDADRMAANLRKRMVREGTWCVSTGSDTVLDVKLCVNMVYSRSLRCLRLILPAEEKRPNVLFVL